jgi:hypothetical protein
MTVTSFRLLLVRREHGSLEYMGYVTSFSLLFLHHRFHMISNRTLLPKCLPIRRRNMF